MRKWLALLLSLTICLTLVACGNDTKSGTEDVPTGKEPQETVEDEEPETALEPEKTPENFEPDRVESDELTWDFDSKTGTLSIHGEGPMRDYINEAPEWEPYKDQILTVTLDDKITSVGAYAFFNYGCLKEVRLPDSVEVIDCSAFDYDWELRTITIPSSLRYVGARAFYNTLLWEPKDLVFPEGLEYIGDDAFHSAVKSGGVVSLPSTLRYLGERAFTNCYFLSDFLVAEGNETYCSENHAIYTKDKKELRMIAPDGEYAGEFVVPDGVEKISAECFNVIHGIQKVTIPASVTEIPEETFFSTFDLKEIIVDKENLNYKSEDGLLLTRDGKLLLAWPDGIAGKELTVPDGVERIGAHLFYGRTEGTYTVVLPEGLKEIGTMSLPYSIAELKLPASLETIDDYVFYDGISVRKISYDGTKEDWEKISVGNGNDVLKSLDIVMN